MASYSGLRSKTSDSLQTPTTFPAPIGSTGITPTTIRDLEESFVDHFSAPESLSPQSKHSSTDMPTSSYSQRVITSEHRSSPRGSKRTASGVPVDPELKAKLDKIQASAPSMDPLTAEAISVIRSGKSRQRIKDDELPNDEAERRKVRRERNKVAAARCRKRRLDLTNTLQDEVDELEGNKSHLERSISDLQSQKDQLQFILQTHQPMCSKTRKSGDAMGRMGSSSMASRPSTLHVTSSVQSTATDPVHKRRAL